MATYGQHDTKRVRTIVESQSDTAKLAALKAQVAELQRIIREKQVQLEFKDKIIELAEEVYGVDIKKNRGEALRWYWQHREKLGCSLNMLYRSLPISKQAVHQWLDSSLQQAEQRGYLLPQIAQLQQDHPTLSCRAMYAKLQPEGIGRDHFEQLCRHHGFSTPRNLNTCRTTDSTGVVRFDNLLENLMLSRINEAWSSDITYYEVGDRFYYLTFIMDCYSRRILGYSVSARLTTEQTTLPALKQAVGARGGTVPPQMIFHSDGGGQY
jgi:hypothetical protein